MDIQAQLEILERAVLPLENEIAEDAVATVGGIRDGKLDLAGGSQRQLMGEQNREAAVVGMTLVLLLQAELNAASAPSP